jgi:phage tail sheath protein FI
VTLARDVRMDRNFFSLTIRRLCLAITTTIQNATRWAVFESATPRVAERLQSQIHAYLCSLADAGAFADDNFAVICDGMRQISPLNPEHSLTVMLMFRPAESAESIALTLHQTPSYCRVATTAFAPASAEVA